MSEQVSHSAPKYEVVYRRVAEAVANVIETEQGTASDVFQKARIAAILAWESSFKWPWSEQGYRSKSAFLGDRWAQSVDWKEGREAKRGSRRDRANSLAAFFAKIIRGYAPDECDLVLDLGCGWGHRMIDLYLTGLNAPYVGGDRSDHTRSCISLLATLFPSAQISWTRFDFLRPDYGALPDAQRILVYTCFAIEQVRTIGGEFLDRLFERFPTSKITCVHIEPVSHQIDPSFVTDGERAARLGQNLDLMRVISSHPSIEVLASDSAITTEDDAHNALVVWKRTPAY